MLRMIKDEEIIKDLKAKEITSFTYPQSEYIFEINEKVITNANGEANHCYLNLKMENGIYHIKYQFHKNQGVNDTIRLGLSTDNTFSDDKIYSQLTIL